jgi:hypothetical protein
MIFSVFVFKCFSVTNRNLSKIYLFISVFLFSFFFRFYLLIATKREREERWRKGTRVIFAYHYFIYKFVFCVINFFLWNIRAFILKLDHFGIDNSTAMEKIKNNIQCIYIVLICWSFKIKELFVNISFKTKSINKVYQIFRSLDLLEKFVQKNRLYRLSLGWCSSYF